MRKLRKFTASYGENALVQWKKLKEREKYEDIRDKKYTIELLKLIKEICYKYQDVRYALS